eukprot:11015_1
MGNYIQNESEKVETKSEELATDEKYDTDDDCDQEAIVNENDGRRRITLKEAEHDHIFKCIGYMEITFEHKDAGRHREMGTGTVFHVKNDGTTLILTAAHNVRTLAHGCKDCNKYFYTSKKHMHQNCKGNLTINVIVKAAEIRFSRRSIYNKYTKVVDDKNIEVIYGDVEDMCFCDTNTMFIDEFNYKNFPTATGGYDVAIIQFKDNTKYYTPYVENIILKNGFSTIEENKEFSIWGFPGDKVTDQKQNGLWGMESLDNGKY